MARIPEVVIQQVLDAVDVVDLVSEYLSLKRSGTHYKGLCPFHQEKTPSFTVNPAMRIFKCFGCGKGGNVIGFLMEAEGLTYREAIKQLADRAGIAFRVDGEEATERRTIEEVLYKINDVARGWFRNNLDAALRGNGPLPAYLEKRALDRETRDFFQLGYAPESWQGLLDHCHQQGLDDAHLVRSGLIIQNDEGRRYDRYRDRLIFPIRNVSGSVIGFGGRLIKDDPKGAKYINSPESELYHKGRELYAIFEAKNEIRLARTAILVEGYMDVISLWQAGIKNVVASLGTALTKEQALLLRRFSDSVIFLYDGDAAGQKAMARGAGNLLEAGLNLRVCRLPEGQDPDDAVKAVGAEEFRKNLDASEDYFQYRISEFRRTQEQATPRAYREFVQGLLAGAICIQDTIQRHELYQRISRASGIPQAELGELAQKQQEQQQQMRARMQDPSEEDYNAPPAFGADDRRARVLFSLFLRNADLRNMICDDFDLQYVSHPLLHAGFVGAFGAHLDPEDSVDSWAHSLENEHLRTLALNELVQDIRNGDARECEDLLMQIQQETFRQRLTEINQIFRSNSSLEQDERQELESEFTELNKSLRQLRLDYKSRHH